jgi:Fe-S cluster biosynthesis and repair protein YggX
MIKPNLNEKDLENFSIKPVQRGEGIFHGAKQITVDFDPTIKVNKFSILTNVENVNIQSKKNRELLIKQLDKFIESGDVKSASSYINLSSRDMRSVLKLMGKFKGYEEGVFISGETPVYEHRPPMNEIGNKFIAAVAGEINRSEAIDAINSSETYLISKELNKSINENFKTKGDFLESYTSSLEKLNKNIISVDNVGVARLSLVDKTELSKDFNDILEENVGVKADEKFSDIVAKRKGAAIGKYRFFVPPSAADLELLTYDFLGYGKAGEKQKEFFNKTLFEPYANGIALIDAAKQSIKTDYKTLLKSYPKVSKELGKLTPDGNFTYDQALRVSMWTGMGV